MHACMHTRACSWAGEPLFSIYVICELVVLDAPKLGVGTLSTWLLGPKEEGLDSPWQMIAIALCGCC